MAKQAIRCMWCDKEIVSKDEIGICRKLLGKETTDFYCLEDFAEYLGCPVEDLQAKIEEFKEEGCTLFQ